MALKINFNEQAAQSIQLSELHNNREKLDSNDIVGRELTIEDFDLAEMDDDTSFAVFHFKEYPNHYYNGGLVLTKMVNRWVEAYGSIADARDDYKNSTDDELVKIRLTATRAKKSNNNLFTVDVIHHN